MAAEVFTAVQDRLTFTVDELKVMLKIDDITDPEQDAVLLRFVNAVKARADAYLQNHFLDPDDEDIELDIPEEVYVWCMQQLVRYYERPADGVKESEVRDMGKLIWEKQLDYTIISHLRNEWF